MVLWSPSAHAQDGFSDQALLAAAFTKAAAGGCAGCSCTADSITGPNTSTVSLGSASSPTLACSFVAGFSYTCCSAAVDLAINTATSGAITAAIYSDTGGSGPGSQIGTASGSINATSLPSTMGLVTFTGMSASLTSGTTYWLVLADTVANNSAHPNVGIITTGTSGKIYRNNGSWLLVGSNESFVFTNYHN